MLSVVEMRIQEFSTPLEVTLKATNNYQLIL